MIVFTSKSSSFTHFFTLSISKGLNDIKKRPLFSMPKKGLFIITRQILPDGIHRTLINLSSILQIRWLTAGLIRITAEVFCWGFLPHYPILFNSLKKLSTTSVESLTSLSKAFPHETVKTSS